MDSLSLSMSLMKTKERNMQSKAYPNFGSVYEELRTNLTHLSNTGGSYCISSVIGGMRGSGTHSSHRSSISYMYQVH